MAIAGGVSFILDPDVFVNLSSARMASPTGKCHTFSQNADGYARGEGCGIVIMKRLTDVTSFFVSPVPKIKVSFSDHTLSVCPSVISIFPLRLLVQLKHV